MKRVPGIRCQVSSGKEDFGFWLKRTLSPCRLVALSLLMVLVLAGCSAGEGDGPQPPEMAYGFDTCSACGMLIDEPRFAAAMLLANGETRKFDDIGEMMMYHMDHPNETVEAWFVHDYGTEEWVRGEEAYFVMAEVIHSPMGSGVAAFAEEGDAAALAEEHGVAVMDMDRLRAAVHGTLHSH